MSGYSPILELGDGPITPREKVEKAVERAVLRACNRASGVKDVQRASLICGEEIDQATDAILTALASGSGDHAELARQLHAVIVDHSGICSRAGYAIEALLAENAELRAENEKHRNLVAGMVDKFEQQHDRATEAERKLAEAVGLLRRIEGMCPATCETSLAHDMAQIASEWLSKEAERG